MQIKPSSYFLMLILLFTGAVIGSSLTFRYFESALLPLIIGGLVFILGSFELWRELAAGKAAPRTGDEPDVKRSKIGSTLAWLLGFAGAVYLAGFLITVPLYLLSYLRWRKRSWPTAIAVAAFTTIAIYGIFEIGFRAELWKGLIFS
ncbi:MAG: tripartite tricarboxylate transporter TctB family protein [Deltaproteobacteria bacterium]|nr:tripartite tricarboxylate transporter TctB family protein [Deltaproteobacteria bacterium]